MKSLREAALASAVSFAVLSLASMPAFAQTADPQTADPTTEAGKPKPVKKTKAPAKKPAALNFDKEFGGNDKSKDASSTSRSVPMDFSYIKTEKPKKHSDDATSTSSGDSQPNGFAPSMNSNSNGGGGFSPGMKLGF